MFDWAFGFAIGLIGALLATHYYFKDKIRKNFERRKDEYSEMMAKIQTDDLKKLIEKYFNQPIPPYDELQKYYSTLYKKQFDGLDDISEALKLENLLSNTMFLFFVAASLSLLTGLFPYISITDFSLSAFSIPSMIFGVIATIMACFGIYQMGKKV